MITQEYLKEILHYDPDTGIFTWLDRSLDKFKQRSNGIAWNKQFAGKTAGSDRAHHRAVYRSIGINGSIYQSHRLAWLYVFGELPKYSIDHIDGNGSNNRITNLRDVTNQDNLKNQRIRSSNTSGCMGVSFHKGARKWNAYIHGPNGRKSLGFFLDINDAIASRRAAEVENSYHENHGKNKV